MSTCCRRDWQLLELEIVGTLREKCLGQQRAVVVALDAFPLPLQPQLDEYVNEKYQPRNLHPSARRQVCEILSSYACHIVLAVCRLTDDELRLHVPLWPEDRWGQVLPLLKYCRDNGVRVLACGTPAEVSCAASIYSQDKPLNARMLTMAAFSSPHVLQL